MMKNFKMATGAHSSKLRTLLSSSQVWLRWSSPMTLVLPQIKPNNNHSEMSIINKHFHICYFVWFRHPGFLLTCEKRKWTSGVCQVTSRKEGGRERTKIRSPDLRPTAPAVLQPEGSLSLVLLASLEVTGRHFHGHGLGPQPHQRD